MSPAKMSKTPPARRRTRKGAEPTAASATSMAEPEPVVEPSAEEAPAARVKVEPAPVVFLEAPVPVEKAAPVEAPARESEVAPAPAKKRGRPSKADQYKDKIGVMADEELAALAGVAVSTVRAWRLGRRAPAAKVKESRAPEPTAKAPAPAKVRKAPKVGKERKQRRTRMDDYLDQIGLLPDSEVAALAGVTVANVSAYRRRRGIPAPGRKGRGVPVPVVEPAVVEPVVEPVAVEVPVAVAEPVPAPPAAAPVVPAALGTKGYLVVASDGSEFIVLADDFTGAATAAVRRLAKWKPGIQVVALEHVADFLPD